MVCDWSWFFLCAPSEPIKDFILRAINQQLGESLVLIDFPFAFCAHAYSRFAFSAEVASDNLFPLEDWKWEEQRAREAINSLARHTDCALDNQITPQEST
jgi:hypothetical protein